MRSKLTTCLCMLVIMVCSSFGLQTNEGYYNIVYIGDGITQAGGITDRDINSPAAKATAYLLRHNIFRNIQFSNQGYSGYTTVDFLPTAHKGYPKVIQVANTYSNDKSATLLFSIMLGIDVTNGSPISAEQYCKNLKTLTDSLFKRYPDCKVIYHNPLRYSYSTSIHLIEDPEKLQGYLSQLKLLVDGYKSTRPNRVFLGDIKAFKYFEKHTTDIHVAKNEGAFYLNQNGSAKLGEFWAKAIAKALR